MYINYKSYTKLKIEITPSLTYNKPMFLDKFNLDLRKTVLEVSETIEVTRDRIVTRGLNRTYKR